jgi:hypothetical protein
METGNSEICSGDDCRSNARIAGTERASKLESENITPLMSQRGSQHQIALVIGGMAPFLAGTGPLSLRSTVPISHLD